MEIERGERERGGGREKKTDKKDKETERIEYRTKQMRHIVE